MFRKKVNIPRVGKFEKVPFSEFRAAMLEKVYGGDKSSMNEDEIQKIYNSIKLPTRGTKRSAGYDFYAPFGFTLTDTDTIIIPTGIRVKIKEGWFLGCFPKSGLGTKYETRLLNTAGIIDSDYYEALNYGHIMAGLGVGHEKEMTIQAGDKFMQGIFIPHGITTDDSANDTRTGGFGSTGK
jgi:dUTP pyrophosphatase